MGTRGDFYIGRGENAVWLGSLGFDAYPDGHPKTLVQANTREEFCEEVKGILVREGGRFARDGWGWPWEDSHTTDFSYAWDDGKVWVSCFGSAWDTLEWSLGRELRYQKASEEEQEAMDAENEELDRRPKVVFPNMGKSSNVIPPDLMLIMHPEGDVEIVDGMPEKASTEDRDREEWYHGIERSVSGAKDAIARRLTGDVGEVERQSLEHVSTALEGILPEVIKAKRAGRE